MIRLINHCHFSLVVALAFVLAAAPVTAFQPRAPNNNMRTNTLISMTEGEQGESSQMEALSNELNSKWESFQEDLNMRWNIFQESGKEGYDFKQRMADALAGEYDREATKQKAQELIDSAPCVMFTWKASPSCKDAVKAFDMMGVEYKNVPLDEPWEEGNLIRAEIGRMVGRSSVPMIFIDGKYVGGYNGGVSEEAPGLVDMAFKGTLRPKLEAVGALSSTNKAVAEKVSPLTENETELVES